MSDIIIAENIKKSFKTIKNEPLHVLKGISLSFQREKISVIIGSSGAGKSTFLHLLGGIDRPDSGKVLFDEKNIFDFSDEKLSKFRNENIGFVFQFHHLLPEFTAIENVSIPQMINGRSLKDSLIKSEHLLELVGLKDRLEHKPAELSGGEQQRVAVARALANDPSMILADEPTGNLDSKNSDAIHQLLFDLREKLKTTFIVATHNASLVNLADNVYEMKDGLILQE